MADGCGASRQPDWSEVIPGLLTSASAPSAFARPVRYPATLAGDFMRIERMFGVATVIAGRIAVKVLHQMADCGGADTSKPPVWGGSYRCWVTEMETSTEALELRFLGQRDGGLAGLHPDRKLGPRQLRDRDDLKLLTGCADDIPNSFAHQ